MNYVEATQKIKFNSGYIRRPSWKPTEKVVSTNGKVTSGGDLMKSLANLSANDFEAYDPRGNKL